MPSSARRKLAREERDISTLDSKRSVEQRVIGKGEGEGNTSTFNSPLDGTLDSKRNAGQRRARRLLSDASDNMPAEVAEVLSFRGRRDLLRASRLLLVMRHGAAILENDGGSSATYNLSEQVNAIDVFLSHNWAVTRRRKFLCLALHFNLSGAFLVEVIAVVATAVAAKLGFLLFEYSVDFGHNGCGCTLLTTPLVLAFAFFGHELQRLCGIRGRMVFLDKTCIHQEDAMLKAEGIRKLGAFIRSSSKMVILYTDLYLTKLWTIYELACFLSLHPPSDLVLIPTFQPVVIFSAVAICYFFSVIEISFQQFGLPHLPIMAIKNILIIASVLMILRRWAREKKEVLQRMAHFQVRECTCFSPDDRPVVYRHIALLMRVTGEVDADTPEPAAIDAFDGVVRGRLSKSLASAFGPVGLEYWHVVVCVFCSLTVADVDWLLAVFSYKPEWIVRYRLCMSANIAMWCFGVLPLFAAALSMWSGLCLHLKGCTEWLLLGAGMALFSVLAIGFWIFSDILKWAAVDGEHRNACAAVLGALLIALTVLANVVFKKNLRPQHEPEEPELAAQDDGEDLPTSDAAEQVKPQISRL